MSDSVKYLGFWLDENLKFDAHINSVERKIACVIVLISKTKVIFSLRNIAATLPCSHLPPPILCRPYLGIYLQVLSS